MLPFPVPRPRVSPELRFWKFVDASGPGECWLWTGSKFDSGYGRFTLTPGPPKKYARAHRWAWEQVHGPVPDGLILRHACDTPECVNPGHLSLGTPQDNMDDMVHRHRGQTRKLDDGTVSEIQRRYAEGAVRQVDLAAEFGTTQAHVSRIVRRANGYAVRP